MISLPLIHILRPHFFFTGYLLIILVLSGSGAVQAQGKAPVSLADVFGEEDSVVKTMAAEEQEASVDEPSWGRVAGVNPSFEDVLSDLGQQETPPQKVSSAEDIQRDLEAKMGDQEPVILIVSDHTKTRVMQLRKDPQAPHPGRVSGQP